MARINGVSKSKAGPMVRLVYRLGPRMMKKLTGRAPQTGSGMEPIEIWAYQPKMMMGMGKFNQAVRKGTSVDERLKNLVELKGAQMIGCEFCVDLGSQICRNSGFSDDELLALPRYRQSDLFTEREKLALDYAVAVMRTPVEVTDELFARIKEHFSDEPSRRTALAAKLLLLGVAAISQIPVRGRIRPARAPLVRYGEAVAAGSVRGYAGNLHNLSMRRR